MRLSFLLICFFSGFCGSVVLAQTPASAPPATGKTQPAPTTPPAKPGQDAKGKAPERLAVPNNVLTTFYMRYERTKQVVWSQEGDEFVVNFKLGEHPLTATYAPDGQWLHTTQEISINQLPREIIAGFAKRPAFKMKSARKAESYLRGVVYEVRAEKDGETVNLVFLPDGRLASGQGL